MDRMEDIEDIHKLACQQKHETYVDPNSGLTVFTEYSHLKRGRCCGCGCRHCPFRAGKKSKGKSCEHKDGCSAVTPSTSESVGSRSSERPESEKEPKNLVYTKTGDNGTSMLFNGDRVAKTAAVFEALGTVDELSSFIGAACAECKFANNDLSEKLEVILSRLLDVGSHIATPKTSARTTAEAESRVAFDLTKVGEVEQWIEHYTEKMPNLTNFVLATGGRAASSLHICRTVCRRAERRVAIVNKSGDLDQAAYQYINRLSDFLFVAARWACFCEEGKEFVYGNDTNRDGTRTVYVQESGKLQKKPTPFCWGMAGLVWSVVSTFALVLLALRTYNDYGLMDVSTNQKDL